MPTMPNLVGLEYPVALANLINAGLRVQPFGYFQADPVILTWQKSVGSPPGLVLAQTPASGTLNVVANSPMALTVSSFPMGVAYPAGNPNVDA